MYLIVLFIFGNFFRIIDCVFKLNMRCFIVIKVWFIGQDIIWVVGKLNFGLGISIIYVGYWVIIGY